MKEYLNNPINASRNLIYKLNHELDKTLIIKLANNADSYLYHYLKMNLEYESLKMEMIDLSNHNSIKNNKYESL